MVGGILIGVAVIHGAFIKYRYSALFHNVANVSERLSRMRASYSYLLLVWIYLTLPGTSTTIFTMLKPPSDADPNDVIPGDDRYLTADLRISCVSDRYEDGVRWAYTMLFIYPVVII